MADGFKLKKMGKAMFADIMAGIYEGLFTCPNDGCGGPAIVLPADDENDEVILCLGCWFQFDPETGKPLPSDGEEERVEEEAEETDEPAAKTRK